MSTEAPNKLNWSPFVAIFVFLAAQAVTLFRWGIETQSLLNTIKESTLRHEVLIIELTRDKYTQTQAEKDLSPLVKHVDNLDMRVSTLEKDLILRGMNRTK